jgi:DNA polymerase-3 subunit epsilon
LGIISGSPLVGGIVDVETTGFSPDRDEVVELCLLVFHYDRELDLVKIMDEYVGLREPGCFLHPRASQVHGLTMADLCGQDLDYQRVAGMIERVELLIAHNAGFDRGFVTRLFPQAISKPWFCSMSGIDWRNKGYPSRGLQELLRHHGIAVERAHRALDDVRATLELLNYSQTSGISYLKELLLGRQAAG